MPNSLSLKERKIFYIGTAEFNFFRRPPLRRSHKQAIHENAMSHDIDCFFRYNGDRLVRKDITGNEKEIKKINFKSRRK